MPSDPRRLRRLPPPSRAGFARRPMCSFLHKVAQGLAGADAKVLSWWRALCALAALNACLWLAVWHFGPVSGVHRGLQLLAIIAIDSTGWVSSLAIFGVLGSLAFVAGGRGRTDVLAPIPARARKRADLYAPGPGRARCMAAPRSQWQLGCLEGRDALADALLQFRGLGQHRDGVRSRRLKTGRARTHVDHCLDRRAAKARVEAEHLVTHGFQWPPEPSAFTGALTSMVSFLPSLPSTTSEIATVSPAFSGCFRSIIITW